MAIWIPFRVTVCRLALLTATLVSGIAEELSKPQAVASEGVVREALVVKLPDAELKRSRGLMFYRGRPFTGLIETVDNAGKIVGRDRYRDGQRHGVRERWHANGTLESSREYRANRKHGIHRGWYANGQLRFQMEFSAGRYEGERKEWHESGRLAAAFNYRNGQEVGAQKVWDPNGNLRSNYVVRNGRRYGLIGAKPCVTLPEVESKNVAGRLFVSESEGSIK